MGEEGPYYAIVAEINNLGSVGGLLVNTKFKVLNDERTPIKGLYAVGLESEGVLFNDTYVGNGVGIGYSFTSGRLGGENAADYALTAK
ncbi:MAG: FAD-binding protein [Anaerocolumna sp.]|nr:FAD-binding protein [Anaerocolumna sp.]